MARHLGYTHINHVDNLFGDLINPYNTFDLQFRVNLGKLDSHLNGMSMNLGVNEFDQPEATSRSG